MTPWTGALQVPLSKGFFRWEYWSGLRFPSPGDLPDPGVEPASPVSSALQADSLHAKAIREAMLGDFYLKISRGLCKTHRHSWTVSHPALHGNKSTLTPGNIRTAIGRGVRFSKRLPVLDSWQWTGNPGMLQSMGSQRVRHDWMIELNCPFLIQNSKEHGQNRGSSACLTPGPQGSGLRVEWTQGWESQISHPLSLLSSLS